MLTLGKIKTPGLVTLLVMRFISMIILQFFGFKPDDSPSIFLAWNMSFLSLFILLFLLRYKLKYFTTKYIWLVLFAVASVLLTVLSAVAHNNISIYNFSTDLILPSLFLAFFFVLAGRYRLTTRELQTFNKFYIFFAFAIFAYNLVVNYDSLVLLLSGVYDSSTLLTSSIFTNRNPYGFMMSVGVVASFIQMQLAVKKSKRLFYIVMAVALAICTLSSMSRGALLFCIIAIVAYAFFKKGVRGLVSTSIVLVSIATLAVALLGVNTTNQLIIRGSEGASGRDGVVAFGIAQLNSHNILFGVGPSLGNALVEENMGVISYHNTYLTLLVTGGITALLVFVCTLGVVFSRISKIRKANRVISALFMGVIIAYMFYGLVESSLPFLSSPMSFIISLYALVFPLYTYNYYQSLEKVGDI